MANPRDTDEIIGTNSQIYFIYDLFEYIKIELI